MNTPTRVTVPEEFSKAVQQTDHTALGAAIDAGTIETLCTQAASVNPYPHSVCVQGKEWGVLADKTLRALDCREDVAVCAVGDRHFPVEKLSPLAASNSSTVDRSQLPGLASLQEKLADVEDVMNTADVFDMVVNIEMLIEKRNEEAVQEIVAVREAIDAIQPGALLRVICETGLLRSIDGEELLKNTCAIIAEAATSTQPHMLVMKTATGFVNNPDGGTFGATLQDIQLMKQTLPSTVGIKASGGVSKNNANAMLAAGADFIGASKLISAFL